MSMKPLFIVCAALLTTLTLTAQPPASMKEPRKLAWTFKEKDRFQVETQVALTQIRRTFNVPEFRDVVRVNTRSTFVVRKVDEDEGIQLEQTIDSTQISFEGTNRLSAAGLADTFTKMQGSTFRITLGSDWQVKKFDGYAEMLKRLNDTQTPEAVERFRQLVTEDDLKRATEEGFGFLPESPVKVGETWTRPCKLHLAAAGVASTTLIYTLQSISSDGKAKIQVASKGSEFKGDLAGSAAKPDFAIESRTGSILFDTKTGRLVSSDINLRLKGTYLIQNPTGGLGLVPLELIQQNIVKISLKDRTSK